MHPSAHARVTPDKPALVMAASGETMSYAELEARSNQGAHLLRAYGLSRGDGVAFLIENEAHYLEIVWAAQRAGLYYTCISTRLTPAEIAFIVRDSGSKLVVASSELAEWFADAVESATVVTVSEFVAARADLPETPIVNESPGNDMLYSSGTTGRPKGIRPPLPDGPLVQSNPLTDYGVTRLGMDADTVFLSPAPLYHSAPLRWCMSVQKLGGTVIVMERFEPAAALAAIERHRVTHAQWVPTHFIRLLKLAEAVRASYDLSSLRTVFHAAAPCPVPVKQAMLDWWGPIVHEFYGGTESNGLTTIAPEDWLAHPGSVGRAVWGRPMICDEAGEPLPPGETGTIYFADGPAFAYHNDPEKTAASRNHHGWTTIGDVGRLDEDGWLYLTDRLSFTIISGGVNIYPQEVEDALVLHPKVADAAVIGAPHEELGEQVVAVVQPANWADAGPALADELAAWLRPRIGRLKQPRRIDFDRELPRHPTGKLYKRLLRERYWPQAARA